MGAAVTIGIFGFLMANVLTKPGEVFGFIPRWFSNKFGHDISEYRNGIYWLAKVTWMCGKCIAGNIALWYSLIVQPEAVFYNVVIAIFIGYITQEIDERIK